MKDLFDIKHKVAVITGGYGIIASKMAEYLADNDVKVVIIGRDPEKGKQLADKIKAKGKEALFCRADVLDETALEACRETIIKAYDHIDILINAAGGNVQGATIAPDKTIFDLDINDLKKVSDLNFFGTIIPTLVFAKAMVDNGSGTIINISSLAALRPLTRVAGYGAAKAAVTNFTAYLATELASKFGEKFRVNAICPGFIITEQNRSLLTNPDGSYTNRGQSIINHTPFGRLGEADELLGTLHYLISDASGFVTGTTLVVDGGFNAFSI